MYQECPKCKRNKFRIIKGLCQSCYTSLYNKNHFVRKRPGDVLLTEIQKEFLTGCLLGDGWLSNLKYGRRNPSFGVDRKRDDLEYLKWQFSFIENLCSRPISLRDRYNKTTKKIKKHCCFETRFLPSLLEFRKLWYPNEIKIVPLSLQLTKLIMQIWYCDDGSLEVMPSSNYRIKFSTHGFSKCENLFLISLLEERYNTDFSLHKDGNQYKICAGINSAPIVIADLKDNFPLGMERKMP